jgi:hypothetical protein
MKCPVVAMYEDSENNSILGKLDARLILIQKEEKAKEEYEAFFNMHSADGTNTITSNGRKL